MSDVVRLLLEDRKRRAEEIAEERRRREEEARQRERERREEMALLKSLVESSSQGPRCRALVEGAARIAPVQEKLVLSKFVEGDDADAFLTMFERVMTGYKTPEGR